MARYKRFKDEDVKFVWDTKTDAIFRSSNPEDDDYVKTELNIQMLSKFVLGLDDDGEFDKFPGKVIDA